MKFLVDPRDWFKLETIAVDCKQKPPSRHYTTIIDQTRMHWHSDIANKIA